MNPYSSTQDYNQDYNNSVNNYSNASQTAANSQSALQAYKVPDQTQAYQNNLNNAYSQNGFDPNQLKSALTNQANVQTALAQAPQLAQQQSNGYGTTAGAVANNLSNLSGNLQGLLAGTTNGVNALQQIQQNGLTQANQQTGFGLQGSQLQEQALQQALQGALGLQTSAQGQEGITQGEQNNYGAYLNALKQAQAAQTTANAGAAQSYAQAGNLNQQTALAQQASDNAQKIANDLPGVLNGIGGSFSNILKGF